LKTLFRTALARLTILARSIAAGVLAIAAGGIIRSALKHNPDDVLPISREAFLDWWLDGKPLTPDSAARQFEL
jgi:hypothetical protein